MFDRYLDPRSGRSKRWRTGVTVSAAAHAAVGVGLLVATFWNIDKLSPLRSTVVQVGLSSDGIPMAEPGGAPPPLRRAAKTTPRRVHPDETVQPVANPTPDDHPAAPTGDDGGSDHGSVDGVAGSHGKIPGLPAGIGPGIGDCIGQCIDKVHDDLPETPPVQQHHDPEVVPAKFIEGYRISGDPQIAPPETVLLQMVRAGQDRAHATVKMCLDTGGEVSSLKLLTPSGYDAYDNLLLSEMRAWRYHPYRVNGEPVAVCTAVTFLFHME